MFRTHRSMLISNPEHSHENALWGCVEHDIQLPWFYITVRRKEDNNPVVLQIMDPELFVELLEQDSEHCRVETVQLVSPPQMNESGLWMMEELAQFSYTYHPDLGGSEFYEVTNGKCYSMADIEKINSTMGVQKTVLYESKNKTRNFK